MIFMGGAEITNISSGYPSVTLPDYATMITGMHPEHQGFSAMLQVSGNDSTHWQMAFAEALLFRQRPISEKGIDRMEYGGAISGRQWRIQDWKMIRIFFLATSHAFVKELFRSGEYGSLGQQYGKCGSHYAKILDAEFFDMDGSTILKIPK